MESAMLTVYIVQHAEKHRSAGDPGLTVDGQKQAGHAARAFAGMGISRVYASDSKRSRETASIIAATLRLPQVHVDPRFRERMNLETSHGMVQFMSDWERSNWDRDFKSPFGDSSRQTGARVLEGLNTILKEQRTGNVVLVAHGGCTVDLIRDLVGDDVVKATNRSALLHGVRPCAVTELVHDGTDWNVVSIAGCIVAAS